MERKISGEPDLEAALEPVRARLGRKLVEFDEATAAPLRGMAALLDQPDRAPAKGEPVPEGWHMVYFQPCVPADQLGEDGLTMGAGVLPAMPLPQRVHAGNKLIFHAPIRVGDSIRRETIFSGVSLQRSRSGQAMILTTQTRNIHTERGLAITDERQIFFRAPPPSGGMRIARPPKPVPGDAQWTRPCRADSVSIFRYCALTMATHRIHYDYPYATQVEGYPRTVVPGPFTQLRLLELARDNIGPVAAFTMRTHAPLFEGTDFTVAGKVTAPDTVELWAVTPAGALAMSAQATIRIGGGA